MDYIPGRELELNAWAAHFATSIAAAPTTFGLMVADSDGITAVQSAFSAAMELVSNSETKTKATVADKDAKKAAMLAVLRHYAQTIRRNLAISNETKVALGLTITDNVPTSVPAPSTMPELRVTRVDHLRHILRLRDSATPDRRGKPAGVHHLQLFRYVGATPPTSPEQAVFVGDFTRATITLEQASADVGKFAYYYARWATPTGLVGPLSEVEVAPIIG